MDLEGCRVCGGRFKSKLGLDGNIYGRCENCGSLIKIMNEADYGAIDVTYDPGNLLKTDDVSELKRELRIEERRAVLASALDRLQRAPDDSRRPRLLDIGCGMGAFLLAGRELGFDVQGVEPSESHSRIGRDVFGLPIATAYFRREDFEPQSFDIVILSHVIEHLFDPRRALADIADLVRPGGLIMVMTPNAESSSALLSGAAWSMLAPDDHVTMLSPRAARALTPSDFDVSIWTSEYSWQPVVDLLQAVRALWRRRKVSATPDSEGHASHQGFSRTANMIESNGLVRLALTLASAPLWLFNKISGRGACLVAQYRRKAAAA